MVDQTKLCLLLVKIQTETHLLVYNKPDTKTLFGRETKPDATLGGGALVVGGVYDDDDDGGGCGVERQRRNTPETSYSAVAHFGGVTDWYQSQGYREPDSEYDYPDEPGTDDEDEDPEEDPSKEHDPKDEGAKEDESFEDSDETEPFEENETAATPPPPRSPQTRIPFSQTRLRRAQKRLVDLKPPIASIPLEACIARPCCQQKRHHTPPPTNPTTMIRRPMWYHRASHDPYERWTTPRGHATVQDRRLARLETMETHMRSYDREAPEEQKRNENSSLTDSAYPGARG
ncbi:hypothetical protein Tco_0715599 [Tanacetum coccineum]